MSFQEYWQRLYEQKKKKESPLVKVVPKKIETNVIEAFDKLKKEQNDKSHSHN